MAAGAVLPWCRGKRRNLRSKAHQRNGQIDEHKGARGNGRHEAQGVADKKGQEEVELRSSDWPRSLREPGLRLVLATVFEIPGATSGPLQRRGELSWRGNIVITRDHESIAWFLGPHGRASGFVDCVLDQKIAKHVSSRPVVGRVS
jgi:hypothetical protein